MKKNMVIIISILVVIVIGIIVLLSLKGNKEYYYKATMNDNMLNYDLEIIGGNELNGGLYNLSGEWLSELKAGHAIVNENDIKDHPDFKIQVDNKTYTIKSK